MNGSRIFDSDDCESDGSTMILRTRKMNYKRKQKITRRQVKKSNSRKIISSSDDDDDGSNRLVLDPGTPPIKLISLATNQSGSDIEELVSLDEEIEDRQGSRAGCSRGNVEMETAQMRSSSSPVPVLSCHTNMPTHDLSRSSSGLSEGDDVGMVRYLKKLHLRNFMTIRDKEFCLPKVHLTFENNARPTELCALLLILGQDSLIQKHFNVKENEYVMEGTAVATVLGEFEIVRPGLPDSLLRIRRNVTNSHFGSFNDSTIHVQFEDTKEVELNRRDLRLTLQGLGFIIDDFLVDNYALEEMFQDTCMTWWRKFKRLFDNSFEVIEQTNLIKALQRNLHITKCGISKAEDFFAINDVETLPISNVSSTSLSVEQYRANKITRFYEEISTRILQEKCEIGSLLSEATEKYVDSYKICRANVSNIFSNWLSHFKLEGEIIFDHNKQRLIPFVFEGDREVVLNTGEEYYTRWLNYSKETKHICHFGLLLGFCHLSTKCPLIICDIYSFVQGLDKTLAQAIFGSFYEIAKSSTNQFVLNLPDTDECLITID